MKKLRFLVSLTTDDNDYQIEQANPPRRWARKLGRGHPDRLCDNDAIYAEHANPEGNPSG